MLEGGFEPPGAWTRACCCTHVGIWTTEYWPPSEVAPGCPAPMGRISVPVSVRASVLLSLRVNELYVDDPDKDSGGKIDVSLNISLPNLHCECEYYK